MFDCIEYLLKTLDISYKKVIVTEDSPREIDGMFSNLGRLFEASNVSEYQYMYSLTLVFEHLLLKMSPALYTDRLYGFYMEILRRFKQFPKSIALMKLYRSLNNFTIRTGYFGKANTV